MLDLPDPAAAVGVIGGLMAIATAIVAAVTVVGHRERVKQTIEIWKEENEAQAKQLVRLEKEAEEKDQRVASLEADLHSLRVEVTGTAAITQFATEWRTSMGSQWKTLKDISESLQELKDLLGDRRHHDGQRTD